MISESLPTSGQLPRQASPPPVPDVPVWPPGSAARGALLVAASLLLVVLIALLDYATGPHLSLGVFYLVPAVACAWWGGFAHGVLLALAGAVAGHVIDLVEKPATPPVARVWNGVVLFGTLTLVSSLVSRLHAGVLRERRLARTDPLTGAANGRTFYEAAGAEAGRARRASRPLTLVYFDLDDFKQLNDRLGHAAGDAALSHVVRVFHLHLRRSDLLARLGGDEFALLLPETGAEAAAALLGRLQGLLSQEMVLRGWPVTLSVGAVTFLRPCCGVDEMVRQVDALMYQAKRTGKGRLEHVTVEDGESVTGAWRGAERRATARVLCGRTARVLPEGGEGQEELATVRDISAAGVGLHLEGRFPEGTLLVIEPFGPGARTLLARVVRVASEEGGWTHGCTLAGCLDAGALGGWLGDGHPHPQTAEDPVGRS